MKFSGYLLFLALWSVLVYAPLAHWVWGGGFLGANGVGAIDFAGGTVVHINAGVAALAVILYLGKRRGYGSRAFVPHNVPMLILGAGILWFGWFGFNAGSALAAGGLASSAFVATQLGAASAMLGWLIPEWLQHGKATTIGAATGAVAGLVAITPASGYVGPLPAIAIGLAGGAVCYFAVGLKSRLGYDDSLDVVGVHMVGGIVGALLAGVFGRLARNPAGAAGGIAPLGRPAAPRASEGGEEGGLDLSQPGEAAYAWTERAATPVGPRGHGTYVIRDGDREIEIPEVILLETARRVLDLSRAGNGEVARTGSE